MSSKSRNNGSESQAEVRYFDRCGSCGAIWLGGGRALVPSGKSYVDGRVAMATTTTVACACGARWGVSDRMAGRLCA